MYAGNTTYYERDSNDYRPTRESLKESKQLCARGCNPCVRCR